ncbi:FKBP12-associated protein [Linnemannia elongata]|nr:FKBP12-associated protein [Linnemannia elongata]
MTVTSSTSSSSGTSTGHIISTLSQPIKQPNTPVLDNNDDSNNTQQSTSAHRNHAQRNTQRRSFEQKQQQSSAGRSRLSPGAKDYVPSSTSTSTSTTSTTTAQSRRGGKAVAGGRIDDDHSQESSDRKQHNNNTGKQQQGRRGGNRHPGNSSSDGPASNRHSARSQRKELNGRTFSSAQTQGHSHQEHNHSGETTSSHAHTHNAKNDHHRYNKTTTRSRAPTPFVHKVEEDRGLLEALTVGLTNSTYDCMVCWDVIRPAHRIWNCQVCWAAFHLDCLSTWAKKSSEETSAQSSGWRCPGCQNTQVSLPSEYQCFCGKVSDPDYNRYFTPHSCGELCGRKRECPHPCNIPCHPGPCPPCGGLGPVQSCHCGNESFQLRCVDTDFTFQTGKSCDQVCGELLGCGKHSCSSVCHSGLCAPCEEEQEQLCYCGKHTRTARCGEGKPKTTIADGEIQIGYYECREACDRLLACGHHTCTKTCHPHDQEPGPCSAMPNLVKTCPCGSKSVDSLLGGKYRTSCQDAIPLCGSTCNKFLDCGHACQQKCHLGPCAPCKQTVSVDCRCGSTHVNRICSDMGLYSASGDIVPTCSKPCRGLRSCGKHQCTNRCCAAKRQAKGSVKMDPISQEAHACTLVCGKKLQCGVHTCEMLCHKGHCNPCLDASFDELSCNCGRTVLYPPIACGTSIPKCRYTCTRERACGHDSHSTHPCHPDSEPCPPCIVLVAKPCMCRKSKMPNVPCHVTQPSCGKICGKRLDCGIHKCIKSCHTGECTTEPCSQSCPRPRKSCGHRCGLTCHGQDACPENRPCQTMVVSSCKCGHLTKETTCQATAENPWDARTKVIKCNDYCLMAERNKRVALALDIDVTPSNGPRIPVYSEPILEYAAQNMEFTLKTERRIAEWIADPTLHTLHLPPMKGPHRKFIHELGAHYNLTSESVDMEPYRSVILRKGLTTSVPDLLASQATRQRRPQQGTNGGLEQLRKQTTVKNPVNAIYLHDLVFGLTRGELSNRLAPIFGSVKYTLRWLTDDDAVLIVQAGPNMSMDDLETTLVRLVSLIKTHTAATPLCERVDLCWVNKEGEVVSQNSTSKRFFSSATGSQLLKKPDPPKVQNAFSALLLDGDRDCAEQDRILKAKEAAGTLSLEAWDEGVSFSSSSFKSSSSRPSSAEGMYPAVSNASSSSSNMFSSARGAITSKGVVDADDNVVDDWQQLLDDD